MQVSERATNAALEEDQLALSDRFKEHITKMLSIPFELIYDLCPLVPEWVKY